ncbi:MAG: HAMP domain-containing sensor histidine kinase [Peptostreptococcaceae bacterium]
MGYKSKKLSLNKQIIIIFTIIMTLTIIVIAIFVNKSFEYEFRKYVDESNKIEAEHLVFDLRNTYKDNSWDLDNIKLLGEDAIKKGIALEVYDNKHNVVWSVFEDERMLSNETLSNIKENMKSIDQSWNGKLVEYQFDVYDEDKNVVGYEKIVHYDSIYFMENDMEFLNIMDKFMIIISTISIGTIIIISILISKSISHPIEKVSKMASTIGEGNYKNKLKYEGNIKEVDELILSINKLADELNEQEQLRKRLTTDISHELRTPLACVKSHLDAIILGVWEPTTERLISINEEVVRLSNLVGDLRKLAKYDSEKNKLNKSNTNLAQLIQNIVYNNESNAMEKNIKITTELKDIYLDIDKDQISQVVVNLISNAIKYTNQDGNIKITNYDDIGYVYVSVKDNGIGIPKEDLRNIFERFYRVDKSRNKETGGIGVGLTIAKSILNAHNGDIIVKSELDKGTEFIIILPKDKN